MTEARLFSSAGIPRTNHASRATIVAHIPVCANRLRFWAAAVVNDASLEPVHGIPTHITVRCENTDPNLRPTVRLHTAVSLGLTRNSLTWLLCRLPPAADIDST